MGSILAWHNGQVDWHLFAMVLLGSMAIQAGTNLGNEYFDFTQGLDSPASLGPAGVIVQGLISPRQVLWAGGMAFGLGIALGLYIVTQVGWPILAVGIFSVMAGWFYTAKPLALGYRGLGEPTVFVFMGPVMVMATYYVHTENLTWQAFLMSLPIGLLVTAILHANNLRDVEEDQAKGRLTWTTLAFLAWGKDVGRRIARWMFVGMTFGAYVVVTVLIVTDLAPVATLLTLGTGPQAFRLARVVASTSEGRALNPVVRNTARLHLFFGALLALGYVLDFYTR